MALLKKHILFFASVIALLLVAGASTTLWYFDQGNKKAQQAEFERTNMQLRNALRRNPAPTEENLAAARQQVEELQAALRQSRNVIRGQGGISVDPRIDSVRFISTLQSYLSQLRRFSQDSGVTIPDNFGFGFSRYARDAVEPPAASVAELDLQRQILEFLLQRLIEAGPQSIVAVQRESVEEVRTEAGTPRGERATAQASGDIFTIAPEITARVDGAINTLAFRISFVGYTVSLRNFLRELALYEQPVVVRSVEVVRDDASTRARAQTRRSAAPAGDAFARLFGAPEEGAAGPTTAPVVTQVPVVEENTSRFTVTVEYIRLIESPDQEGASPTNRS